jgi:hypothetical protein
MPSLFILGVDMITKNQIEKAGYQVLPKGGWFCIDPETIPEWDSVAEDFGFDPRAKEIILCVAGFMEIHE